MSEPTKPTIPPKLAETLDTQDFLEDRTERIQLLIDIGSRFTEVPPRIATRPFDETHRVPGCESEAFVWAEPRPDGNLDFHFAVENPQGISARALATILGDTLSGAPVEQVATIEVGVGDPWDMQNPVRTMLRSLNHDRESSA